eukprot:scaffold147666_cov50-Attheya_sp.AAC.2
MGIRYRTVQVPIMVGSSNGTALFRFFRICIIIRRTDVHTIKLQHIKTGSSNGCDAAVPSLSIIIVIRIDWKITRFFRSSGVG